MRPVIMALLVGALLVGATVMLFFAATSAHGYKRPAPEPVRPTVVTVRSV